MHRSHVGRRILQGLGIPAGILLGTITVLGNYRAKPRPQADGVLLVLGTAQYNGVPSRQFASRLQWAATLWQRYKRLDVVTVGGNLPGDEHTEAQVGREYMIRHQVDPEAITVVAEGNDTRGSLEAIRPVVGKSRVYVITDPLHTARAVLLARRLGINAVGSPTPYNTMRFPERRWWLAFAHECGGLLVVLCRFAVGDAVANHVERLLRNAYAQVRPSRKQRIDVLYGQEEHGASEHGTSQQGEEQR